MFVRHKRSVGRGGIYGYLQIVRSYREGGKVRQQIIGTLGRRDHLAASGELDGLLRSLAKFSEKLRVVEAVRESGLEGRLFRRDLNLFNQTLEVVFIDTTSLYCYRGTETEMRRRGYSRDHRPDLP
jgi:hypothetical protein